MDYERSTTINGASSGLLFKYQQDYWRKKTNNPNLKIIQVAISHDGVELGKGSKRAAIPVFLKIMNLKTTYLLSNKGIDLIGYVNTYILYVFTSNYSIYI